MIGISKKGLGSWAAIVTVWFGFLSCCSGQQNPDGRLPLSQMPEPLVLLIRDRQVQEALQLSAEQRSNLRQLADEQDVELWTTRNQSPEKVQEIMRRLTAQAEQRMSTVLKPAQLGRLAQIRLWMRGVRALADPAVVKQLQLSESQVADIRRTTETTQKQLADLQKRAQAGEERNQLQEQVTQLNVKLQQDLAGILSPTQQQKWKKLIGEPLDAELLGQVDFRAPDLPSLEQWINSPPLTARQLQGKVVVLHFFAFGCINCIHNYPSYKRWQKEFKGQDVVILGVHTPETEPERDFEALRRKSAEEKFTFPIVMDSESRIWNAWGNSMWPSVYLIDRQGRVRYWWLGELNWEGAEGERIFTQRIHELLAEEKTGGV